MPASAVNQAVVFLYSILGGMTIAFIYDLFRIKRKTIKTQAILVYIEDFLYWVMVALVMFAVLYYSNQGEIRGYIFIGTLLGTVLYMLLLSKLVTGVTLFIIRLICRIVRFIWKIVSVPVIFIFKIIMVPMKFIAHLLGKILRRIKHSGRARIKRISIWKKIFKNIRKKA